MEESLTEKEVDHVANLARIFLSDEEKKTYQIELKKLINDIDQIREVEVEEESLLISPVEHCAQTREDLPGEMIEFEELKQNVPKTVGNFVEVPVMIHE